jgi:hypothetical protein
MVHTDREVTENIPDVIIKNKNREDMHADRCGNTRRQKCRAKGNRKEVKIQEFRYRDTTNVEPEMHDYTSYKWSHCYSNEKLKDKSGIYTRKTFVFTIIRLSPFKVLYIFFALFCHLHFVI